MRFCLCVNIKFNDIGAARPRKTGATAEGRARATAYGERRERLRKAGNGRRRMGRNQAAMSGVKLFFCLSGRDSFALIFK